MRPSGHPAPEHVALPPVSPGNSRSPASSNEPSETSQEKTRILVVEDDFLIALNTERDITEAGFEAIGSATTAEELMTLAKAENPSLAVKDIRLASGGDGIVALYELFNYMI